MDSKSQVTIGIIKMTFSLPASFGEGWSYSRTLSFPAGHAFAGSYNRSEDGNFAEDALQVLLSGRSEVSWYFSPGLCNNVELEVKDLAEASAIQAALQSLVDDFSAAPMELRIQIRGSNSQDSLVSVYSEADLDAELITDMPMRTFLVKHVPRGKAHPWVSYQGRIDNDLQSIIYEPIKGLTCAVV